MSYAGNNDTGLMFVDANTGEVIRDLPHNNGVIMNFDISPSGERIAFNNYNGEAIIIDSMTGEWVLYLNSIYDFYSVGTIDWHPSLNLITIDRTGFNLNGGAMVIDASDGSLVYSYSPVSDYAYWSLDGEKILTIQNNDPLFFTLDGEVSPQIPFILDIGLSDGTEGYFERLTDGMTLEASLVLERPQLQIEAISNLENTQSVTFSLNGVDTVDDEAPFAIPYPSAGTYTLTVTPFIEIDGAPVAGTPLTVRFGVE